MPAPYRRRRNRPPDESHECEYRAAVARVRIDLEQAVAMHDRNVPVSAVKVLDLLNPRGMWRYVDAATEPMAAQPDEGELDPLTGCRSAAPKA